MAKEDKSFLSLAASVFAAILWAV